MNILIVDDSVVFRSQIKAALDEEKELNVVGSAPNGRIALQRLEQCSVDLVVLDLEMPEMGGLETLKIIREKKFKTKVIVFSSQTTRGSEAALEALSLGADDFLPKPSGEGLSLDNAAQRIKEDLLPKVLQFWEKRKLANAGVDSKNSDDTLLSFNIPRIDESQFSRVLLSSFSPELIVIGSSTGGPAALETIFSGLSGPLVCPILICQHMPPIFTASLASRLSRLTGLKVDEGVEGEKVENRVYVAPGDFHMSVVESRGERKIKLDKSPKRNNVRPAVDVLFESAASLYKKQLMGFVLTGMGSDGLLGCQKIKSEGGGVMIQNEESCTVYGMPRAVCEANSYDQIGDLRQIGENLRRMAQSRSLYERLDIKSS